MNLTADGTVEDKNCRRYCCEYLIVKTEKIGMHKYDKLLNVVIESVNELLLKNFNEKIKYGQT